MSEQEKFYGNLNSFLETFMAMAGVALIVFIALAAIALIVD